MIKYENSIKRKIKEIYERNQEVTGKELSKILKCDLNWARMCLSNLKYDDGKAEYKSYMTAPPPTKDSRHHDSNRWHDIEEDIKEVDVDELYKQATR